VLAKPGRDSTRIRRASGEFLSIRNPSDTLDPAVVHESRRLDAGEREVITLASVTLRPVTAILDDAAGRRVATRLGIPVLGFIGLLIAAKQSHLVELVTPLIEQARQEGYWISDELLDIARNLANE
jgi:predicted nucleic acid-binding protein